MKAVADTGHVIVVWLFRM